jgi:REP element-mobilizing transposase RayT
MSPLHHRRSLRLKGYDYAHSGAYFVTICTHKQSPLFGHLVDGTMVLNQCGEIVRKEWFRTVEIRTEIELHADEFVVMPNHIHGIVWIVDTGASLHDTVGAHGRAPLHHNAPARAHGGAHLHRPPRSLGSFIAGFKSTTTRRINQLRGTPGAPVWQRNYYEHIIRTEQALHAIRRYIVENPLRWHLDRYNPDATGPDPLAHDLKQMLQNDARTGARPCAPTTGDRVAHTDNEYPTLDQPEDAP